MTIRPWREIAEPHEDVRSGNFQQAEFAADLASVHAGTANAEYQNPAQFFERTFITEGMRLLLHSVVQRLAGRGGDPVIQLQTAFGGGKTHTLLAVYHLATSKLPASELPGVSAVLDAAGVADLPRARIALLDGVDLLGLASAPRQRGGCLVHTIWGELAWQLGGSSGYQLVRAADETGTAPGKQELAELLGAGGPSVILMDELVRYVSQFEEGTRLSGGTYDTQLSFVQALTEAAKAVPTAVLLASLPYSDREAGSRQGVQALRALEHYFGRVQAIWKPVSSGESFEIVRRRLFSTVNDRKAVDAVCRAYADYYREHRDDFPPETQESGYHDRLLQAYPVHPEVFDRLYEDWSTLDNFQRTRGVLKLMAKVIHRLWKDGNNDALILPGSIPLLDADTRNEAIYYLPPGWDPVIERDVDGERSETWKIENDDPRLGSVQACRRVARTIFLGSAPGTAGQTARGIEQERILLGATQPGQQIDLYKDALRRLGDRLHYLNQADSRYWLDVRPNLRREMEDRKRRYRDRDDIHPVLRERLQRSLAGGTFDGVHVFTASGDIPDDGALRLVVLPPDAAYVKAPDALAYRLGLEIVRKRGDQPRFRQNRLLFLAADSDTVGRLLDQARSFLAWGSIIRDYEAATLVLDNLMARQAQESLRQAEQALQRTLRDTYRWLLVPAQDATPGKGVSEIRWEEFALNPGATQPAQEIARVLRDGELVIDNWAPYHLGKVMQDWFWTADSEAVKAQEVWQQFCQQLYLPRLRDLSVLQRTLAAGASSRDFFGLAQGREGQHFVGFTFDSPASPVVDADLLVIEPGAAQAYWDEHCRPEPDPRPGRDPDQPPEGDDPQPDPPPDDGRSASRSRFFYGKADLDALGAKRQFADIVDEVVQQFTTRPDVNVRIVVEIQAESTAGFDASLQRAVKENANVLRFVDAEFESGG